MSLNSRPVTSQHQNISATTTNVSNSDKTITSNMTSSISLNVSSIMPNPSNFPKNNSIKYLNFLKKSSLYKIYTLVDHIF